MLQKIRWFSLFAGVLVLVIIAFQNSRRVELDVLFFHGEYPLTLIMLGCSAAGFLFGGLTTGWMLRGRGAAATKKDAAAKPE